ncbi:30S ribosomal protein S9, partial [Candidatus Margulisiibacteriota bacterium]
RVMLTQDGSDFLINKRPLRDFFKRQTLEAVVLRPFVVTNTAGQFTVKAKVSGGGLTGQAHAVAHGISRALLVVDPSLRDVLKKAKLLTRDSRVKERKKYGLKKARKATQYRKR